MLSACPCSVHRHFGEGRNDRGTVGLATRLFPPHRHSGEGRNPGDWEHGGEGIAGFAGYPPSIGTPVVIPAAREWMIKPLDSGLRRNDGGG